MVLAFVIVLALQIYGGGRDRGSDTVTKPIERANVLKCRTQIRSLTTSIEFFSVQHGRYPEDLQRIDGISKELCVCPVTQTEYQYDPETGKVFCPDHP